MLTSNTALTLEDLPLPPVGKTGWPWTEATELLTEYRLDNSNRPRISIVTPSYNQGQFIEETIRSVLLQGYPNLEYIVIDGGSTDNSVEIIKKYQSWLTYWVSEKDQGQSEAINKGFQLSTGTIMGWVNSDDLLAVNALYHLANYYKTGLNWWVGGASKLIQNKEFISGKPEEIIPIGERDLLHARIIIPQVSTFWTRELWKQVGGALKPLELAMDYELWLRFSKFSFAIPIHFILGIYRTHDAAKTGQINGFTNYLLECDIIRIAEYQKRRQNKILRFILISFWTRFALFRRHGWRSWFGRRAIPYV